MSEIVKRDLNNFVSSSHAETTKSVGKSLMVGGVTGGAGLVVAGALPFITFPMILVFMILSGLWLYAK